MVVTISHHSNANPPSFPSSPVSSLSYFSQVGFFFFHWATSVFYLSFLVKLTIISYLTLSVRMWKPILRCTPILSASHITKWMRPMSVKVAKSIYTYVFFMWRSERRNGLNTVVFKPLLFHNCSNHCCFYCFKWLIWYIHMF